MVAMHFRRLQIIFVFLFATFILCAFNLGYLKSCSHLHRVSHSYTRSYTSDLHIPSSISQKLKSRENEFQVQTLAVYPLKKLQEIIRFVYQKFTLNAGKFNHSKTVPAKSFKRLMDQKHFPFNVGKLTTKPDCKHKSFLLIAVHSTPESFTAREGIRLSWGQPGNDINQATISSMGARTWKTIFLVGKSHNETTNALVKQEAAIYQDIVIGEFLDTYRNLTLKTLLTLKWPAQYCPSDYLLKTDEDCYVNVLSVMKLLYRYHKTTRSPKPLYMGRIHWENTPSRGKDSKFYVTKEEYSGVVYPPYAAGGGYVFTASLIPDLLKVSMRTAVFPMEDVYLGILMQDIGVKPTDSKLFLPYEFCKCINRNALYGDECVVSWADASICHNAVAMVIHGVRPVEQIRMHINVLMVSHVPSLCEHEKQRTAWKQVCNLK